MWPSSVGGGRLERGHRAGAAQEAGRPAGAHRFPRFHLALYLADTPAAASLLEQARRVSPARYDADYSYLASRMAGRRYHHFRRFAVGFYDPAFRDLWFIPRKRLGVYEAIVAVLAGNWRPSLLTRARIWLFFVLVDAKRLARRLGRATAQDQVLRRRVSAR